MARPMPPTIRLLSYLNEDVNALISIYVNVNVSRLGIMYANLYHFHGTCVGES